jgi:hypothetical protein
MQIEVKKSQHNGWQAKSSVNLGDVKNYDGQPGVRVLSLSTSKGRAGQIESFISACIEVDTGRGYSTQTHEIFGDYSKRLISGTGKATEKNVRAAHDLALTEFPKYIEDAKNFYAAKDAEKAAKAGIAL